MFSCFFQNGAVYGINHFLAVDREKLYRVFSGFVGAEKSVCIIVSASVNALCHDIIQSVYFFRSVGIQDALGALSAVNIAGEYAFCVVQDRFGIVGENDLHFSTALTDYIFIIVHIVNTGKYVFFVSEQFSVFFF